MPQPTRRLLMIAYHFPPLAGSSGIQRTLRFVQHLPKFGWQALVLTTHERAYLKTSDDLLSEVPGGTVVRRAFALDTARHLSIGRRHVGAWARPDRWVSWRIDGVRQGLRMIDEFAPDAIFSTFPIATAHLIGAELQRRSGLPWIADFRDPMAQEGYPEDPKVWASYKAIEQRAMDHAATCLFTTPSATQTYRETYPQARLRIDMLENGYDEDAFAAVEAEARASGPIDPGVSIWVHSGAVYPAERDPTRLFEALQAMKLSGEAKPGRLRLRFRAPVHDALLNDLAGRFGVRDLIEVAPPLPYGAALAEMLRADALLLMQASSCNEQVPAKVYEYLRARRPLLCLSDPRGDTVQTVRRAGIERTARLDSAVEIRSLFGSALRGEVADLIGTEAAIAGASREGRARALAATLDGITATTRRRVAAG
jgi:hypothetical protein